MGKLVMRAAHVAPIRARCFNSKRTSFHVALELEHMESVDLRSEIRKADAVLPVFARAGQRSDTLKRVARRGRCRLLFRVGVQHIRHESRRRRARPRPPARSPRARRARGPRLVRSRRTTRRERGTPRAPPRGLGLSRLSALCIYVRSLSVSAVGHGGVVIHSTVTITELKSILLLTELKSSQNQVYTADCAAFTEVALRP